jgi:hypothetical protein
METGLKRLQIGPVMGCCEPLDSRRKWEFINRLYKCQLVRLFVDICVTYAPCNNEADVLLRRYRSPSSSVLLFKESEGVIWTADILSPVSVYWKEKGTFIVTCVPLFCMAKMPENVTVKTLMRKAFSCNRSNMSPLFRCEIRVSNYWNLLELSEVKRNKYCIN